MTSKKNKFVFCVVGYGSIGRRHASNLKKLGERVIVYRSGLQNTSAPLYDDSLEFIYNPSDIARLSNAIIICTPTSMHIEWITYAIKNNLDFYVEKPICESYQLAKDLESEIYQRCLITSSGYMMRYELGILRVKDFIEHEAGGPVLNSKFQWSSYLPDWHPWEDYRTSYAAQSSMGGGALLTCSHELDTIRYLFGEVELLGAKIGMSGALEMDVEDIVDALFLGKNKIPIYLHIDWYQKIPSRNIEISCLEGILKVDLIKRKFSFDCADSVNSFSFDLNSDLNQMYVDSMSDFISCVKSRNTTRTDFSNGLKTLQLCNELKKA